MKKFVFIIGGIFLLMFITTFAFMWWLADTLTFERNRNKTSKARETFLAKRTTNGQANDLEEEQQLTVKGNEDQETK